MPENPETRSPALKRVWKHRLLQWLFAYVAGAWILLEFASFLVELFGWPDGVLLVLLTLFSFGLLAASVLAWYHGEPGRQEVTRPEVALLSGIATACLIAVLWVGASSSWVPAPSDGAAATVEEPTRSRDAELLSSGGLIRTAVAGSSIADPRDAPLALAVLPFRNLGDPEDVYFADGITEDILFEVSLLPGLRVISSTSTAQYRGSTLSLVEIGQQLDVDLVLEGSVRWVGDEARIVAQLIEARTDEHLWSGSYDHEISNILSVQAEVAEEVVRALATALAVEGAEPDPRAPPVRLADREDLRDVDPEVYRLLIQGRRLVRSSDPAEVERGVEILGEVIRREPRLESAFVALADVLEWGPTGPIQGQPGDPGESTTRVRNLARESLESAKSSTRPGRSPAWQLALDQGALADAEAALKATLAANPNDAGARRSYGLVLAYSGLPEEGLKQLEIARSVDPNSAGVEAAIGSVLVQTGRFLEATVAFEDALGHLSPESSQRTMLRLERAFAIGASGDTGAALAEVRAILADAPENSQVRSGLGYLLAMDGREGEAREVLAELQALDPTGRGIDLAIAQVLAALGDRDEARAALARATEASGWVVLSPAARRVMAERP